MSTLGNSAFDITCPKCGYKIKTKVGSIKDKFNCPSCGVAFDASELKKGFASVDKSLEDLKKSLRGMFK